MHIDEKTIQFVKSKLIPWQISSVRNNYRAVKKHGSVLDASDLGTGKTYSAIAVCKLLGLEAFVICPKAVIPSWNRAAKHFDYKLKAVINYEKVRTGKTPFGIWVKAGRYEAFEWVLDPATTVIIFDECQKMKSPSSQNCKLGMSAIKGGFKVMGISGTAASDPTEMKFAGRLTKQYQGNDWYRWMFSNGVVKSRFGQLEFKGGPQQLKRIHQKIFPEHGTRIRIADIPDYPESDIRAETFNCDGEKIQKVYDHMAHELKLLREHKMRTGVDNSSAVLACIMAARQEAEILKTPAIVEMAEDYLENGMSVVIFTNFRQTMLSICGKLNAANFQGIANIVKNRLNGDVSLKGFCAVHGSQTQEERQMWVDKFQRDEERVIVVNMQSGGAGLSLHDLNGKYPRASIICPSWSAIDMKQATGRVWRAGALSKSQQVIFYAADTIEERICEAVKMKLKNIDLLNDGDLNPLDIFK